MGVWRIIYHPDKEFRYYEERLRAFRTRAEAIAFANEANGLIDKRGRVRKAKGKKRYTIRYEADTDSLRPPSKAQVPTVSGGLPGLGKRR